MSFLLDTNVVSEWVKPVPSPEVLAWLREVDEDRVYLSVITLAEIRHGIERLGSGSRRQRLAAWLADDLPARFEGRILDVDRRIAATWGVTMARARAAGSNLGIMDAFLAATAEVHSLTLATRNLRDFAGLGLSLLNPWEPPE